MKHQTPDSMKFRKLARRLGLRLYEAVGVLELLWLVTQKNAPRGDIGRYDNEEIAIALDWAGDPEELVATLVDCGWLDECREHRLIVHDWHEHAPRYVHGVVTKLGGFVTTVRDCSPPLQSLTTVAHCSEGQPNLTYTSPNQLASPIGEACTETPRASSAPPPSGWVFPVKASKALHATEWMLPKPQLDEYQHAYGAHLVVEDELRKALLWLRANPTRRKTAGGMLSFLTKWLNRASNSGGGGGPPTRKAASVPGAWQALEEAIRGS